MSGHVFLSLEHLAGNSCKVSENVLCPAIIVSPAGSSMGVYFAPKSFRYSSVGGELTKMHHSCSTI